MGLTHGGGQHFVRTDLQDVPRELLRGISVFGGLDDRGQYLLLKTLSDPAGAVLPLRTSTDRVDVVQVLKRLQGVTTVDAARAVQREFHVDHVAAGDAATSKPYDRLIPEQRTPFMSPKEETLRELAEAMLDQGIQRSTIPAAYTYLGQLLAHDMSHLSEILTDFGPVWENEQSLNAFHFNALFGTAKKPGVKSSEWLEVAGTTLGMATDANHSGSQGYDLPRLLPAGAHCCQDPRTDSNLALAQMHVLLVRFHQTLAQTLQLNTTVAIRETRRHLQAVIATDYLHRIIPEDIYTDVMQKGRRIVAPEGKDFLVSLEFAVAVFRFGHSMVRPYYFPWQLNPGSAGTSGVFADISSLLSFVSGGGALTSAILPNGWSQFWHHMCGLDLGDQNDKQVFARPIGTRISAELGNLQKSHFPDVPTQLPEFNIAFETMRRGRRFNLPSGQQIAAACNEPRVLDVRSFLKVHPKLGDFAEDAALCKSTPLWFYTLAEAEAYGTDKLGPVAARIVMETFHAALEKSPDSILSVSEAGASEINFERKVRIGKGARAAFSLGDVVSFSYQTEH